MTGWLTEGMTRGESLCYRVGALVGFAMGLLLGVAFVLVIQWL